MKRVVVYAMLITLALWLGGLSEGLIEMNAPMSTLFVGFLIFYAGVFIGLVTGALLAANKSGAPAVGEGDK